MHDSSRSLIKSGWTLGFFPVMALVWTWGLLVSTQAEAKPRLEIETPLPGAWLSDQRVWLETRAGDLGCESPAQAPVLRTVVDGVAQPLLWKKLTRTQGRDERDAWGAWVQLPAASNLTPAEHWIHLTATCSGGKRGYTDSVRVISGAWIGSGGALERALSVALTYMADHPIEDSGWDSETGLVLDALWDLGSFASQVTPGRGAPLLDYVKAYHTYWAYRGEPDFEGVEQLTPALSAWKLERDSGLTWGRGAWVKALEFIRFEPRNSLGTLSHRQGKVSDHFRSEKIWTDSLVMYPSFALQYALDEELFGFSLEQPVLFAEKLQDQDSGLFSHAYRLKSGKRFPSSPEYWGRANGFALWGGVEAWSAARPNSSERMRLSQMLKEQLRGLEKYQLEHGLWDQVMNLPRGTFAETSSALWVAAGLLRASRIEMLTGVDRQRALQVAQRAWAGAQAQWVPEWDRQAIAEARWPTSAVQVLRSQLFGAVESSPPVAAWKYKWLKPKVNHPLALVGYIRASMELARDKGIINESP